MRKITAILLITLAGCSLGERPKSTIYAVRPGEFEAQKCKVKLNLQIAEPTTSPGLDTRRIAVYQSKQQLNYYSNARWIAPVPEMLQTAMIEGFEKSGAFKSVSTDIEGTNADVILLTDIRSYQVEDSSINIRFISKVINADTRKVRATIPVERTASPSVFKIDNIIETFSVETNEAVKEVIAKSLAGYPGCKGKKS